MRRWAHRVGGDRGAEPSGEAYRVPQMTGEYRQRMHSAGLVSLGEKLDAFARTHGVALSAPEARLPGSGFGDAYADCLAAAERTQGGLQAREVVLGRGVPYRFGLGPEFELAGTADLAVQALPEAGEGAAVIEVHEFSRQAWARAALAGRNLRVLAAFLARPVDPEASGAWRAVDRVVYRHWATGEAMEFRETSVGRLLAVVHAVACGVVIARALSGYETCRECGDRERCWGEGGWDALDFLDPAALAQAARPRETVREVRQALAGDDRATERARQALRAVEAALAEAGPGAAAGRAVLMEAMHATTTAKKRHPEEELSVVLIEHEHVLHALMPSCDGRILAHQQDSRPQATFEEWLCLKANEAGRGIARQVHAPGTFSGVSKRKVVRRHKASSGSAQPRAKWGRWTAVLGG